MIAWPSMEFVGVRISQPMVEPTMPRMLYSVGLGTVNTMPRMPNGNVSTNVNAEPGTLIMQSINAPTNVNGMRKTPSVNGLGNVPTCKTVLPKTPNLQSVNSQTFVSGKTDSVLWADAPANARTESSTG